jgi:protein TonB
MMGPFRGTSQTKTTVMKPDVILQSDMLDILFENRNKAYGAYALRKNYDHRLLMALGGTCLLVGLMVLFQSIQWDSTADIDPVIPEYKFTPVTLPAEEKPKVKPAEQKASAQKKERTITNSAPVIKPNVETNVPTTEDADKNRIGTAPSDGEDPDGRIQPPPGDGPETTGPPTAPPAFDTTTIRQFVDVQPAFIGDFNRYMLRNLRQPSDLEEGQRIQVRVRFVVTREGDINDVQVVQSGRPDLDQEVLRVVKRMPRWKPAMQSGRNVPVYFNLPVVFVNEGE